jgi:hypothetical protein
MDADGDLETYNGLDNRYLCIQMYLLKRKSERKETSKKTTIDRERIMLINTKWKIRLFS